MSGITNGWSSYAANLEQRVVTQNWISYHRRKGRFSFRRIHEPSADGYGGVTIGFEMTTRAPYRWDRRNESRWFVQCYQDGIALYRRRELQALLNRRTAFEPIDKVMNHYYYVDTEVEDPSPNPHHNGYYRDYYKIVVMRRKPLSTIARSIALRETNLGDFLVTKYNMRGTDNAVISR